jgi:hypothetical protein
MQDLKVLVSLLVHCAGPDVSSSAVDVWDVCAVNRRLDSSPIGANDPFYRWPRPWFAKRVCELVILADTRKSAGQSKDVWVETQECVSSNGTYGRPLRARMYVGMSTALGLQKRATVGGRVGGCSLLMDLKMRPHVIDYWIHFSNPLPDLIIE